ncbi:tRNA adenosine(34) deaminase TadA [Hydrogenophilus islandicus]
MAGKSERTTALTEQRLWDRVWMRWAVAVAEISEKRQEVPVGAVVVANGVVLAVGYNHPISGGDPTLHAEIVALRAAAERCGNYRLPQTALYVTVEPCVMCAGAIFHARVGAVIFGAPEPKSGVAGSVVDLFSDSRLNPHAEIRGGVMASECAALLQRFFRARRKREAR